MIFDEYDLPKDVGATDSMDSARLAGMMSLVGHAQTPDLRKYVRWGLGIRHPHFYPSNYPWNFSRDQLIPLAAGLYAQNHILAGSKDLYFGAKNRNWRCQNTEKDFPGSKKKFPDGADFLFPQHILMLTLCAQIKPSLLLSIFGKIWLFLDLLFNALFTRHRESNQLIALLFVMGPFWMRLYKAVTPSWEKAIKNYWCGWRGEPELAEMLIHKLKSY